MNLWCFFGGKVLLFLCEFSSEKKIQCKMCFISENLLLPQRRENTTKHWYEHIKTKNYF
jgi:hypothetical protein